MNASLKDCRFRKGLHSYSSCVFLCIHFSFRLQLHSRALGCKVKSESSKDASGVKVTSYIAMLKIPLSFPEPSKGRKSRK